MDDEKKDVVEEGAEVVTPATPTEEGATPVAPEAEAPATE